MAFAAFNTKTGDVLGETAARHTSAEFVAFLTDIVVNQPRDKEIHVIADNLTAHKTGQVKAFLEAHPKVHIHFTPTYSSWLNQVELCGLSPLGERTRCFTVGNHRERIQNEVLSSGRHKTYAAWKFTRGMHWWL